MKDAMIASLERRVQVEIAPQSPIKILNELDLEVCFTQAVSVVYLYTRMKRGVNKTVYLTEVVAAIGHGIIDKFNIRRNSATAAKMGAFFLWTFEDFGMIEVKLGQGNKNNAAYIVEILDDESIVALWETIPPRGIQKLPKTEPYEPWTASKHPIGTFMVKTGDRSVNAGISYDRNPILFDSLNRSQQVGWKVNEEIKELQKWALRNKAKAYADIWDHQNPEARSTKMREARATLSMADRFKDETFYHLYYYDFRGRKYPMTAYLHEQGADTARGLLLRAEGERLGESGFKWLLIYLASIWAGSSGREDGAKTDKIPMEQRYQWSVDNLEILLSYATNPKVNQGWMEADKPWQFLAGCMQLRDAFKDPEGPEEYVCNMEVFIDGSNNGCQHLAALLRDEITARHVNLIPLEYPGDLYNYVATHVWSLLEEQKSNFTAGEIKACNRYIDNSIEIRKRLIAAEPSSDYRKQMIEELRQLREKNSDLIAAAGIVFWCRITSVKERRKIVKRNVMTLPYGGTPYGLGEQQIDDAKKHKIDLLQYMEHGWGSLMGRIVYSSCQSSIEKPMQLLELFEKAGEIAEKEGRYLSWIVPKTNFPVVQHYTKGVVKKVWVQYGPPYGERLSTNYYQNTLQLKVSFVEETEPSKGKQRQAASPNAIHSLDGAHLSMTVVNADFTVTTIHDSFGCLPSRMEDLFRIVREQFVELYDINPIDYLLDQMKVDNTVELGELEIDQILESEYAFA